uniref:Uncharacterized protein n=1 Tax=Caudovirales sp. ctTVN2 TaxID=2827634 RepID=A0A8S5S8B7_9CAUD|nr:MAG TPA: hypothetical protein [Caudovirales sp. ctTVN2]DAW26998.1 MAG TPA: hypothetical protein [Caudoviricetes sp.]
MGEKQKVPLKKSKGRVSAPREFLKNSQKCYHSTAL